MKPSNSVRRASYRRQSSHNIRPVGSCRRRQSCKVSLLPSDVVVDDEPEPSAPPLELMDKVSGYEDVSFDAIEVPPPANPSTPRPEEEPERVPISSGPQLTELEARKALMNFVSRHCCYGRGVAKNMAITKICHSCAFHYTLESFTEKRQTSWAFEPYTGGSLGSHGVPPPSPWDVACPAPTPFQSHTTYMEVPHTASVKTCHMCAGVGRKKCFSCSGNGWEPCFSCHGDGRRSRLEGDSLECYHCHGTGRRKCWKCNGEGISTCRACDGTGQIKCYIKLTITWTNHSDDHVVDQSAVPNEYLKFVGGQVVFQEQQPKVWPLTNFPDTTINMASVQLIQQHAAAYRNEKILMQRHHVRVIPVATVDYHWKNRQGKFSVYGVEKQVYCPDYPQTCCWGCSIL